MILIHYVILGQRLCVDNKVHEVIFHTSKGFTSLEDCVKHYKKYAKKHVFYMFTSDLLSHGVRYILEFDNENSIDGNDSESGSKLINHPAGYINHNGPLEEVRIKWKVCLVNTCKYPHHMQEIKCSSETFLCIRDCILDFWDSDFNRFNIKNEYKIVLELVC